MTLNGDDQSIRKQKNDQNGSYKFSASYHNHRKNDGCLDEQKNLAICSNGHCNGDGDEAKKKVVKYREREQWANKLEFIFALITYAVGLGNVWRFPYLCYKNGGGAFLVPYLIFLIFGAVPILILEVGIGQYFRQGGITAWSRLCPLMKGIGYGTVTISFILNVYYIVIIAWALLYMFYSFSTNLPWATCDNDWNTDRCWSPLDQNSNNISANIASRKNDSVDSVVEFWNRKILQISSGIDEPNGFQWELVATLLIAWIVCFFCIWRGIKSTGKSVYVTAVFPYVVITALFIRGITLPGASEGIKFFIIPDFSRLSEAKVWIDAGTQIFFSYAIALGCMTSLGSYNTINNNFYHQLFFLTFMNSGTSIYAGFAIFSVLGYMAHQQGLNVSDVVASGPGLAFIAYPKAVTMMPGSAFWAIMFFLMILLLGMGSQFVGVEGFITAMVDLFPQYLRVGKRREWFIAFVCAFSFLLALPMVTRGGMYVFQLADFYGASGISLLWFCFFEALTVGWFYNADRMYQNFESMIGFRVSPWFRWCWKFFTPLLTAATLAFYVATYKPIKYEDRYEYPNWGIALGLCMAFSSMLQLPICAVYVWFTTPSMPNKWKYLTTTIEVTSQDIPQGNQRNNRLTEINDLENGKLMT